MSMQLATRVVHVKDGGTYESLDVIKGDDGISPEASVSKSGNTTTITITDKDGTTTAQVLDGTQITVDSALSDTSENPVQNKVINGAISSLSDDLNHKVSDVKVAGTSVVTDGEADIPVASNSVYGVSKTGNFGVGILTSGSYEGSLYVTQATEANIKSSTEGYKPITPSRQHMSVFYGLAKASGDTTQSSSSNPVGTYTDSAKVAIQKMLGIYEPPFELLNDITLDEESAIDLTADSNGTPYNLRDVLIHVHYPANLQTATSGYGRYHFYDENNKYGVAETKKYTTTNSAKYKYMLLQRIGNMAIVSYTGQQYSGDGSSWSIKNSSVPLSYSGGINLNIGNIVRIAMAGGDVEPAGTRVLVYGQRAY